MRSTLLLLAAAFLVACKSPAAADTEPDDAAPDSAQVSSTRDAATVVDASVDSEYCPSPDYPPRTDGCPCDPGRASYCNAENADKVCIYRARCRSDGGGYATRYTCGWKVPFEGPGYWSWTLCGASCLTGECFVQPDAAAAD